MILKEYSNTDKVIVKQKKTVNNCLEQDNAYASELNYNGSVCPDYRAGHFTQQGFPDLYQDVQEMEAYQLHSMSESRGPEHPNPAVETPFVAVKLESELILDSDEEQFHYTDMDTTGICLQDPRTVVELQEEEVEVMEEDEEELQVVDMEAPPVASTLTQMCTLTPEALGTIRSSHNVSEANNSILIDSSSGAEDGEECVTSNIASEHSAPSDSGAASKHAPGTAVSASALCKVCIQFLVQKYCLDNTPNKAQPSMHFCGMCGHVFYGSPDTSEQHQDDPVKQYMAVSAERTPEGAIVKKWLCSICHESFESEVMVIGHLKGHGALMPLSLCTTRHTCRADNDPGPLIQSDRNTHVCTRCCGTIECVRRRGGDEMTACVCGTCGEIFDDCQHSESSSTPEKKPVVSEFLFNSASESGRMESVTCELCGKSFRNLALLSEHSCNKKGKHHACDMCKKSFTRVSSLRVHKLEHFGAARYVCEACGKSFGWACRLKMHKCKLKNSQETVEGKPWDSDSSNLKEIDDSKPQESTDSKPKKAKKSKETKKNRESKKSKSQEYRCEECDLVFKDHTAWKEHEELHLFKCGDCGKGFKLFDTLQDHECKSTTDHENKPRESGDIKPKVTKKSKESKKSKSPEYKCQECDLVFEDHATWKQHEELHLFKCGDCGKGFKLFDMLQDHECKTTLSNESKPHESNNSKPRDSDDSNPRQTEDSKPQETKDSKPQETEDSKPQETEDSKPQETEDSKPQETEDSKPQETEDSKPQETEDSKPQETEDSKPQETEDSKPQEAEDSKPQENKDNKPKKAKKRKTKEYKCKECDLVLEDHTAWKQHEELHLVKCGDCGKGFKEFDMLKDHKCKSTTGSYMCQICERMFTSKSTLRSHTYTHTKERPYPCDICGMRFTRSNLRKVHRRSHTGETPYVCELCGKSFDWPCRMKNHRCFIKTSDIEYLCNNCGNMTTNVKTHRCHTSVLKPKKGPSKSTAQQDTEMSECV